MQGIRSAAKLLGALILILFCIRPAIFPAQDQQAVVHRRVADSIGYVGSRTCEQCHRSVYESFSKTNMGRSISPVTPEILARVPASATVLDSKHNRHFSAFVQHGQLYQSEWETREQGKEVFRETEKIQWIIGAGANAMGGLVLRKGDIFEAPLAFYSNTHAWALSPGYEDTDRGFSRPIDAACISCHSGRPNPVPGAPGQFRNPPFDELAVGCENCHGPGRAHVREMQGFTPVPKSGTAAIVNPLKLFPWLADNICMSCHQTGDARVLQLGRNFGDFRPGRPLDDTLAILMAPPKPESPPNTDHLQYYLSMILSKCYRSSKGKLTCISCHDPHVQPSRAEAPAYYRAKCLGCHSDKSCPVPLDTRLKKNHPDNCMGCHMPRRSVTGISHASLTNHRIIARPSEPFPAVTFHLATSLLPDVVHLDAVPGRSGSGLSQLVLLQAYGQLGAEHPEYMRRYFELASQLATSHPDNTNVLEALAARALAKKTPDGAADAVRYLNHAINLGSRTAWDFQVMGSVLLGTKRFQRAVNCLQTGVQRVPYDPLLYGLLAEGYMELDRPSEAIEILNKAMKWFPQDDRLRELLGQVQQVIIQRPQE
jgi:Tetratricopeptide repeat